MKILVIQQKVIGDVLISSIICNNLKTEYPDAQIDYLVYDFTLPVLENNPNIDNIVVFDSKKHKNGLNLILFALKIRKEKYDIVIDAYAKLESGIITLLSGANKRIGFKNKGLQIAYNTKVNHADEPKSFYGLAIERKISLFEQLIHKNNIDPYPKLFITDSEKEETNILFKKNGIDGDTDKVIIVSIFGSEASKTYPENYLSEVIDFVAANFDVKIHFNYTENQKEKAKKLFNTCNKLTQEKIVFDLIGTDLRSLIKIVNNCNLMIGNDGGAINIAKSLQKPTFTIFSPWIKKESWSVFEDGKNNIGIHVFDYFPELKQDLSAKELKENNNMFYNKLTPNLFMESLSNFLKDHLK